MKWNSSVNLDKYFLHAFDTFTDILSESDYSLDEMDEIESKFTELMQKQEYLEEYISIKDLNQYKKLHDFTHDDVPVEELAKGCIIVLDNKNKRLILDGNHRISTLVKNHPDLEAYVIIFELEF